MKVYVRVHNNSNSNLIIPYTNLMATAMYGFIELGAEIVPYFQVDEIYDEVSDQDIVVDFIGPCQYIFNKFGALKIIDDYPECLREFLGRKIWKDTINSIAFTEEKWRAGWFIKPIKSKAFTGRIISSISDLISCGKSDENYEVYCSEPVDIVREWRCFITYDEIIDIRPYKGDYHSSYDAKVVDQILKKFITWKERPKACSIDIGVTGDNKTILIECNDGYALGSYGLENYKYAKLLSARWSDMLGREDIFDFRKYRS